MKKLLLFVTLFVTGCFAQNVRYDAVFPSVSSTTATAYVIANVPPNSPTLSVCHSPANQVPCTNYVTTYTGQGVACANGSQDTPQPNAPISACQSTGDSQGNIGFWIPPGTYDYTICIANTVSCFGPYTITLGLGATTAGRLSCQTGLGDGLNAIPSGTYLQSFCYNDSGSVQTITGIRCFTNNSGTSTLAATDNSANSLLTGAITCSNAFAAGTQSAHVTIPAGGWAEFTFVADGTSKQTTFVLTMAQAP